MFLQPQHFQYLDQHQASTSLALNALTRPYFWGVIDSGIDLEALQSGMLSFKRFIAVFPDGTLAGFPDNAVLPSRNLEMAWQDRRTPLTVYVGVRCKSATESEVTLTGSAVDAHAAGTRKVAIGEGLDCPDLHSDGATVRLRQVDYVLRLAFDAEKEAFQDHVWLPVAVLISEGRQARLCDTFIPPCINIGASHVLPQMMATLRHTLLSRGRILESFKTTMQAEQSGLSAMAFTNRLALSTVARYLPLVTQLMEAQRVHPWEAFGVVRQLASELSTFSSRFDLGGESVDTGSTFNTYRHDALGPCFKTLVEQIGHMLSELTSGPELVVTMTRETPVKFTAGLGRDFMDRKHALYMVLRTRENPRQWVDGFISHAKLGALGQVDVYARRALPGVGLMALQGKPIGVTGQSNASYFMIERDAYEWGYIQDSGYLGVIWNEAPEDLTIDIVLVRQ